MTAENSINPANNPIHLATCVDEELAARLRAAREATFVRTEKKVTVAAQVREILQGWASTHPTPLPESFEGEDPNMTASVEGEDPNMTASVEDARASIRKTDDASLAAILGD